MELAHFSKIPFLLPASSMKLRKTLDQCFLDAKVKPNIFLESQTTELFMSLYPHNYGAFFCTQMRLPMLLAAHPDANAFPLALKKSLINTGWSLPITKNVFFQSMPMILLRSRRMCLMGSRRFVRISSYTQSPVMYHILIGDSFCYFDKRPLEGHISINHLSLFNSKYWFEHPIAFSK